MTLRTINSKLSSLISGTNNLDICAPQIDMALIHWSFRKQHSCNRINHILIVLMEGVWLFMFLNLWTLSSKMF